MFTLVKNADIHAPAPLGVNDVLVANGTIAAIDKRLEISGLPGLATIDAAGRKVTPGFIDGHVHLIGGGGEGGFHTRTPEVLLSTLTKAGITTAVGLLGTDSTARHNATLFAKATALTSEGITAYMFTGGYAVPSKSIMSTIKEDITFLDRVIGLKTAASDHRSSHPTVQELIRLAGDSRVAGMLSGKCGRVVVHMGSAESKLAPLWQVVEQSDIPISQFIPTHVNRTAELFDDALEWLNQGGFIDLTASELPKPGHSTVVKPSDAIIRAVELGRNLSQLCMSSDGNGSMPSFNEEGELVAIQAAGFGGLWIEFRDMVNDGLAVEQALMPVTMSAANSLGLADTKGAIAVGRDADLLILDDDLSINSTIAKGQLMVQDGIVLVKGVFES